MNSEPINKLKTILLICFFISSFIFPDNNFFPQKFDEYKIKSAYISKITKFILWPEDSDQKQNKNLFILGVIGKNSFLKVFREDYKTRKIKDKSVKIKTIYLLSDMEECDMVFIAGSEKNNLEKYIKKAQEYKILTMSDTKGFGQRGIHVNLFNQNQKILFEINFDSLINAGLKADSLLLDYAKIINSKRAEY